MVEQVLLQAVELTGEGGDFQMLISLNESETESRTKTKDC
ncbi:hypothetical protein CI610_02885 [invertebrate metagenome]|uniref:Uncharacterized protein n=1 Tax=invertebrate metagenome TaxID=1711999 RepID=A0A2H9T4P4_9ZZZZ